MYISRADSSSKRSLDGPEAELAHLREQFEISLAQIRAGQGLTAEESLADLDRYEAELDEADRARGVAPPGL